MFQVNLLNSNYYPVQQILLTEDELEATSLRDKLNVQGKLAGVIQFD